MDYDAMRTRDGLEKELAALKQQEADTEYIIEYLPRTLTVHGKKQTIRLPRHIWVAFDRLIDRKAMTVEELLEWSQLGVEEECPERSYQQNLENFILYAFNRLDRYL